MHRTVVHVDVAHHLAKIGITAQVAVLMVMDRTVAHVGTGRLPVTRPVLVLVLVLVLVPATIPVCVALARSFSWMPLGQMTSIKAL